MSIFLKTEDEIELMREANLLVGKTLAEVGRHVKPGVTTLQLDKIAEEFIRDNGAALITSATDFVKAMGWDDAIKLEQAQHRGIERTLFPDLSSEEEAIVRVLAKNNDLQINLLSIQANIPISRLTGILFTLEMKGVIRAMAGGCYHLLA